MEFSPTFLDFSSWIYLFWKQTKINLVSKYFRFYLTEQVALYVYLCAQAIPEAVKVVQREK